MPLPWKKAKRSRISQLVADHLNTPKHGGSLVVETGFPTSLVDLFVKNRDRLKKPSKKKRSTALDPKVQSFSPLPPFKNSLNSNDSSNASALDSESENSNQGTCFASGVGDEIVVGNVVSSFESNVRVRGGDHIVVEEGVEIANSKGVLMVVWKMFFVVVLALGTKKFAVGVTLSAFLLFSLEYVGVHICRFFIPCSEAKKLLKSLIQRVMCFGRTKQGEVEEELSGSKIHRGREVSLISDCSALIKGHDLNTQIVWPKSIVEDIQVEQPKSYIEEIQSVNEIPDDTHSKNVVVEKEEDCGSEVSDFKNVKSRRAKLKSKMKKLFLKKLRSSKKRGLDLKSEVCSPEGEDKVEELGEDNDKEPCELVSDDRLLSLSSRRYDGQEDADAICSSERLLQGEMETAVVSEGVQLDTRRNSGYLALFLIVLAGLVGGRILALLLTLCWCLMLKSGEQLRRCVKVSMVRSFVKFSC
ncbi:unnamed protein product [Ilex paraguariensis]|uniref:Ethylene-responsive nuclear protein n=1 Tax=Ilex paraguariensis TaxID=185542 RepID=A0ABC8U0Y9_9AQUA